MDLFKAAEKLMRMDDEAWARHANPWSGYSRIAAAVPIFPAIYSAHWIGWWSLLPILVVGIWIFVNPRLWPPPEKADSWITEGVLGERAWINRHRVAVPDHHRPLVMISTGLSLAFLLVAIYGFCFADFWAAFTGWFAAVVAKCWFIDRMVWVWREVRQTHPVYAAWSRADWTAKFDDDDDR